MEKIQTSEVTLKIPPSIAADIGSNEIIELLLDKALGKKDLYKSKIKMFESKYGTNFASFKKKTEKGDENFQEWDDLLLWEGFLLAYREWNRKYKDLKLDGLVKSFQGRHSRESGRQISMVKKKMAKSTEEFDRRFDNGEDIHELIEISKAKIVRHGRKVRITLDVAEELVREIDGIRDTIGADRGALIKVWLYERVKQEKVLTAKS